MTSLRDEMAEAIEGTINVEAHTYEVDAKDSADAILALIRGNIMLGEWYCPDGETLKYQDRLVVYSIFPNRLGEFTLDDGESVKSYRTKAAAKDAALGHKVNTIMAILEGK
jgi:hypothetical protein